MNNIPTEEVECEYCHTKFERSSYELTRTRKLGRKIFCSLSCTAKQNHIDRPSPGHPEFFDGYRDNRRDHYTPFRWFQKVIRNGNRKKKVEVKLEYLKQLWEQQGGICPYTGWELVLPDSTRGWKDKGDKAKRASLDRIDNAKGYIEGNIQYVSFMANIAKNTMTDRELLEFCRAVATNKDLN